MRCPIDGVELVMTDRQGIEIDYCPSCRGVWLDRGELDKIIERSTTPVAAQSVLDAATGEYRPDHHDPRFTPRFGDGRPAPTPVPGGGFGGHDPRTGGGFPPGHAPGKKRKKKKGFLEDLFDFD
ncbi:MAG: zf-TFIIB domain-containing protein [Actinotalea sp.]|nr:zf-TFIIB domain-containing protein [Actinotalea sp.]